MTLAGIELAYLIKEIGEQTEGCYVSNIYGINRNSLLFKMRHPDKPDLALDYGLLVRKLMQLNQTSF